VGGMRYTGTVKWFNEAKGYGFIRREEGPDLFVHYTNITGSGFRTLKEDDKVEFEVNEGPKGLQAVNVEKI
jgi:CspA family cold shock protein